MHEFPLGDAGDKLIKNYLAARALRDLGVPTDAAKKDYKLVDAKTTLTITFKDGDAQVPRRRARSTAAAIATSSTQQSGKAYVLSRDLISGLEIGESTLHLTDPRGFDATKIDSVTIDAGGKSKTVDPRADRRRRPAGQDVGRRRDQEAEPDDRELHRQREQPAPRRVRDEDQARVD